MMAKHRFTLSPQHYSTLVRVKAHPMAPETEFRCKMTQLPINVNDATTGHKLQGMSKDIVIITSWPTGGLFKNWEYFKKQKGMGDCYDLNCGLKGILQSCVLYYLWYTRIIFDTSWVSSCGSADHWVTSCGSADQNVGSCPDTTVESRTLSIQQ